MRETKISRIKYFLALHIILLIESISGICSKMASKEAFMSVKFILFYVIMIAILGVYAVVWQQIIKHMPLTTAFCNKSVEMLWGILWGVLIFHEAVKWNMILGAVIVIIGVIIVVTSDE